MPEARAGASTGSSRASAPSQVDLCVDNGAGDGVNKGANCRAAESGHAVDTRFMERDIKEESLKRGALLPLPPSSQPSSQRSYSLRAKAPNPKYPQQVPTQSVQGSRSNAPSSSSSSSVGMDTGADSCLGSMDDAHVPVAAAETGGGKENFRCESCKKRKRRCDGSLPGCVKEAGASSDSGRPERKTRRKTSCDRVIETVRACPLRQCMLAHARMNACMRERTPSCTRAGHVYYRRVVGLMGGWVWRRRGVCVCVCL